MPESVLLEDGARLDVTFHGEGPPLVLCHGGPGLWDYLEPLSDLLHDECRVIRYDQRGCGRSTGHDGPYTIAQYVDDLHQLRARLGVTSWVVGGHSWGAQLALHYALAHPKTTSGVIYLSGTGLGANYREPYESERARRLGPHLDRWQDLRDKDRTPEEEREWCVLQWSVDYSPSADGLALAAADWDRRATDVEVNHQCNQRLTLETVTSADEVLAQLPSLEPPLLVIHGADDPRPAALTDTLMSAVPVAERVVLADAGHSTWVEQPTRTRQAILDFVRRHGA